MHLDSPIGAAQRSAGFAPRGAEQEPDEPCEARFARTFTLHPYFLVRIAAEPASQLSLLTTGATAALFDGMTVFDSAIEQRKQEVCTILERAVKGIEDRGLLRGLLASRRDFYNARLPNRSSLAALAAHLDRRDHDSVEQLALLIERRDAARAQLANAYDAELEATRANLPRLLQGHNLDLALQTTNVALHGRVRRLIEDPSSYSEKERRGLETTFLSYFARSVLKTTPNGLFTPVALGEWQPGGTGSTRVTADAWKLRSEVSLRRSLVERILEPVFAKIVARDGALTIRANPTVRTTGDKLEWLGIKDPGITASVVYRNRVTTVQVKASRLLLLVRELVEAPGASPMRVADLRQEIRCRLPEIQPSVVERYVGDLIANEFLLVDVGYSEQCDFLGWAQGFLSQSGDDQAHRVGGVLAELASVLRGISEGKAASRIKEVARVTTLVRQLATDAGSDTAIADYRSIVVEDAYLDVPRGRVDPKAFAIRRDLERLLELMPILDPNNRVQAWAGQRFVDTFGADGICNDWMPFFIGLKRELEALNGAATGASKADRIQALLRVVCSRPPASDLERLAGEFFDHMQSVAESRTQATLDARVIDELIRQMPDEITRRPVSHCFVGQFMRGTSGQHDAFVLNRVYQGNSKILARFLPESADCRLAVRRYLRGIAAAGRYMAIPGVFGFNVNLHSQLAEDELRLPPFQRGHAASRGLEPQAFHLFYDAPRARVALRTHAGEQIDPFYFGLLIPAMLPAVHYMLDLLFAQATQAYSFLVTLALRKHYADDGILHVPRISLGSVVLSRDSFIVARNLLPELGNDEKQFFFNVQEWRLRFRLPAQAFVSCPIGLSAIEMSGKQGEQTHLRPSYVDFTSPLMVRLFRKVLRQTTSTLVVAEVLPLPSDAMTRIEDQNYVSEFAFELARVVT